MCWEGRFPVCRGLKAGHPRMRNRGSGSLPWACSQEFWQSGQITGGHGHRELGADHVEDAVSGVSHAADGLGPAQGLLDLLAVPLGHGIAGMRGPPVDARMPDLLGDMRRHDHPPGSCQTDLNSSQQGQFDCPLCRTETAPLDECGGAVDLEEGSCWRDVSAQFLPQRLVLDSGDDVGFGDEVFEEVCGTNLSGVANFGSLYSTQV